MSFCGECHLSTNSVALCGQGCPASEKRRGTLGIVVKGNMSLNPLGTKIWGGNSSFSIKEGEISKLKGTQNFI